MNHLRMNSSIVHSPILKTSSPIHKKPRLELSHFKNSEENYTSVDLSQLNLLDDSGKNALHHAIDRCDCNEIQRLVVSGVDVNAKDSKGNAPIHIVVTKYFDALQKHSALIDSRYEVLDSGDKLAYISIEKSCVQSKIYLNKLMKLLTYFCLNNANLSVQNGHGDTVMHMCIHSNGYVLLKVILGFDVDLRATDSLGLTPLAVAAMLYSKPTEENADPIMRLFMDADLEIIYQTENGKKYLEEIKSLLKNNSDDYFYWYDSIQAINEIQNDYIKLLEVRKITPLIKAIKMNHANIVRFLLKKGGLDMEYSLFGLRPALFQAMTINTEIQNLISNYAK